MGFVLLISSIVIFYITYYIRGEKHFYRFTLLVYLFVLSMVFLILSPNIIRILLGWDGLGLVSYCLVIYYQNIKSANAGMLTILSNRVGDVAILLRISWILNYGSWNFIYLFYFFHGWETTLILILVGLAAITKSAQMPFSAWLPAAMAAPTPVSALVHSSTLVTAGVYLLVRFNYLLGCSNILFYIGVFTIFISGLGANFENDLKKIIALSTLSQLGLIIIILSLGFSDLSFFHLLAHALFKSLLFLCAGVFIHCMGDIQDIRQLGGVSISCPVTSFYFTAASLALCGFPFLAGFYSKDLILEISFLLGGNLFITFCIILATIFTLTYSLRLCYYLFLKSLGVSSFLRVEEEVGIITPISLLFILSVLAGSLMSWFYFPFVFIYLPFLVKILVMFSLMLISLLIVAGLSNKKLIVSPVTRVAVYFMGSIWLLPYISTFVFMPLTKIGEGILKMMDQGWLEQIGGQGAINKFNNFSAPIDYFASRGVKTYLFTFFLLFVGCFYLMYLGSSC